MLMVPVWLLPPKTMVEMPAGGWLGLKFSVAVGVLGRKSTNSPGPPVTVGRFSVRRLYVNT